MPDTRYKECLVAYATPQRQYVWRVKLPAQADIQAALLEARKLAPSEEIPWEAAEVGIFGELRRRTDIPLDGDRIELYRPLARDPRTSRRERLERMRTTAAPRKT